MPLFQGELTMAKYNCKQTCFHSDGLKTYTEGVQYDLSASLKKEFDRIGFLDNFELETTPTLPEVAEKEPIILKKG